jgi:hypothetical protein
MSCWGLKVVALEHPAQVRFVRAVALEPLDGGVPKASSKARRNASGSKGALARLADGFFDFDCFIEGLAAQGLDFQLSSPEGNLKFIVVFFTACR